MLEQCRMFNKWEHLDHVKRSFVKIHFFENNHFSSYKVFTKELLDDLKALVAWTVENGEKVEKLNLSERERYFSSPETYGNYISEDDRSDLRFFIWKAKKAIGEGKFVYYR